MENDQAPIVIIGSGLAGYTLARALRKHDSDCPIVVITADGGEVYTKPMLSNALAHRQRPDDLVYKDAATMAAEQNVEIKTRTKVATINRKSHSLEIKDDTKLGSLAYDRLVLALGAEPRIIPAEGSDTVDIVTVNNLDDYRRWCERIGDGGRILLIGAGLIGCEFANDLATAGFGIAIVDPAPWPLVRLLPEEIGMMLANALRQTGCELYLGRSISRYRKAESGFVAELDNGIEIAFDHALSAVGLTPRTELARKAELEVDNGIVVDRLLRTSDADIFALGDCAQTDAGILPFVAPLLAEAKALGATLSGNETPLHLPALPVIVKTPALPLVVCPPPPGTEGTWEVESEEKEAVALFRNNDGDEVGFALAGDKTDLQWQMANKMPALLPAINRKTPSTEKGTGDVLDRYKCNICSYIYDPEVGDPDGGIPPGTPWEEIPDDWICPICGAGKGDFTVVLDE